MEQYALYLVIKKLINELGYNFKVSFNDFDTNADEVIGIYVRGGNTPEYRELSTGKYYNFSSRIQILIQSGLSKNSLLKCLDLSSKIREVLTSDSNNIISQVDTLKCIDGKIIEDKNNTLVGETVDLGISKSKLIGDIGIKDKTPQNRSIYSINLLFDYFIIIGG